MSFKFLNFYNISGKYSFPFFFDLKKKDIEFYRYAGFAFDYLFETSSSEFLTFLDFGLKKNLAIPLSFFFFPFPFKSKDTRLLF
jgi:hypothetical protein